VNKNIRNAIAAAFAVALVAGTALSAAAGERIYIPLGSAGEVVVVEVDKDAVVGTIVGLPAVHGLAGTPDGRYLIAGSYQEREAGVGAPTKPSSVSGEEHEAHHRAPAADAQIANPVISTVSVIRIEDQSVVRRIDVPGAVHHVAVSPSGRLAAVTHPNAGTISAIDLDTYEVVATVATGALPNYAVFSPDGDQLYVSNAGDDTVSAIDTWRWIVGWKAPVGGSPEHVVLSNAGASIYVNNVGDGTVSVIDVADRKVVRTIPVGTTLHGIDLSDDGGTLFVAALGEDTLVGVELATGIYRSTPLSPAPYHLAAVRGSGKLYVSSADEPKVWVVDQSTLSVIGEIPIGGKGHQMVQGPGA